jgi:hypothetical protein
MVAFPRMIASAFAVEMLSLRLNCFGQDHRHQRGTHGIGDVAVDGDQRRAARDLMRG